MLAEGLRASAASHARSAWSTTACFPYTVGGAERWYRNLGERLAADGHEVTYLTLRQWDRGRARRGAGRARGRAPGRAWQLYAEGGRRRILPPLVFGAGVLWHLLRHGRRYDVVHTASFPYFSLLAAAVAAAAAAASGWWSTGTRSGAATTGASTSGRSAAASATAVQALCLRVPQRAFCFSQLHARRLRGGGL